ncbi:MAG TPA: RNA polymerase sigma factor [Vineibacter sp.]|nr:RNA polymerase sigma factor [Vineibacter sp.]
MTASTIAFGNTLPVLPCAPLCDASDRYDNDIARQLPLHVPALRRYARTLTGDTTAADDLVQDCAERALARAHLWQGWGSVRAWLFTIMHNLQANNRRRAACRPRLTSIDHVVDPPGPAGQLDKLMVNDTLVALRHLSPTHREVLSLVVVEGMTYAEAAEITGVAPGTVM